MKKRIFAILLAALMLAGSITGCSNNSADEASDSEAVSESGNDAEISESAEEVEEEEERIKPNIPETADYGGDEINFLVWSNSAWANTVREYRDIYAEEPTGESINDAVYNRNILIEGNYNVKITEEKMDLGQIDSAVSKEVAAGGTAYDVVYPRLYEAANMFQKGYFHNLLSLPNIDFTQPWWDSNCVETLSTNGVLPCVASSINVNDKDATVAVAFNKTLATSYNIENLYDAVNEGTWTIDKVCTIAEACNLDTDGDGTVTEADQYGFLGGNDVMDAFWHGAGGVLVSKDEEGQFCFTFGTERDIDVATTIVTMMNQPWFFNHHTASNTDDDYYTELFETGHGLFFWMRLDEVTNMRNGDADFGILPVPKYEETQEEYYSFVSQHTTGLMSIPLTVAGDSLEELTIVLEALAAESHYTLIPTYIETSLKTKYSRDSESGPMLDIIINNRVFDPMAIYNFGSFGDTFTSAGANQVTDFASLIAKSTKIVNKSIEKVTKALSVDEG